jgi:hypothetical protein
MSSESESETNHKYLLNYISVEDLIFQCTPESLQAAKSQIISNFEPSDYVCFLQMIISASSHKYFSFRLLGDLFQTIYQNQNQKFPVTPFTDYLYLRGILTKENLMEKPKLSYNLEYYENFFKSDPIRKSIYEDNLPEFCSLKSIIDLNSQKIQLISNESLSYLAFSAYCGSINIFKYLLLNQIEIDGETIKYSIFGGNETIISLIYEQGKKMENFISHGITSHHNNVCHWLIDHFNNDLPKIDEFIKKWNISLFFELHPIEEFIHENKDNSLFLSSAIIGNSIFLKYLISQGYNIESQDYFFFFFNFFFFFFFMKERPGLGLHLMGILILLNCLFQKEQTSKQNAKRFYLTFFMGKIP